MAETDDGDRAFLFAAHFKRWKVDKRPPPICVPAAALSRMPLSTTEVKRRWDHHTSKGARKPWSPADLALRTLRGLPGFRGDDSITRPDVTTMIEIDDKTWVTSVTVHVVFANVGPEQAIKVFKAADPRSWADYGCGFWKHLDPVEQLPDGTWRPTDPQKWDKKGSGFLHEVVNWNWNDESATEIDNYLEILDIKLNKPAKATDGHYEYKYRLRLCKQAKLFISMEPGGLDLDQGYFTADWDHVGNRLTVGARKRIHFAQQPNSPEGFDLFLNLMAPAVATMFIHQSAVYGIQRVIAGDDPCG